MTFLVAAALAIAVLVAVPIAAHLLRRGRAEERDFPPAALVPAAPPVARQRSRLEDRALLAVRGSIIVALALLGATPFVSCSRLSLSRPGGASLALALVVDDSLSMRATVDGKTRFQRALDGAHQLLRSARDGDAIAIVLAGRPARLALAATTDLGAVQHALDTLTASDRATDLAPAVQIARSAIKQLPQIDKRVVVLSDLAGDPLPAGEPALIAPLTELRSPADDCGVVSAEQRGRHVDAVVACSSPAAAQGRTFEVVATKEGVVGRAKLATRAGTQTVGVELPKTWPDLEARLDGKDALAHDDSAPIAPESNALGIAVVADTATGSVTTGGPTVLEQALAALARRLPVRPLPLVPDDPHALAGYAILVLDDPSGISPEARAALGSWLDRGGVALGLLGPAAENVQLGTTLEPFVRSTAPWEPTTVKGVDAKSMTWLGADAATLADIAPRGRARLDGEAVAGARVAGRWQDGHPFLLERDEGRGLVATVGLPSSVDQSDFALRPAFLALLDHIVDEAEQRSGPRRSKAGTPWLFAASNHVAVTGPAGPVTISEQAAPACIDPESGCAQARKVALPTLLGRYHVDLDGDKQTRFVSIDASEIVDRPQKPDERIARASASERSAQVDASPALAAVLAGLFALELALRLLGRARRQRPHRERRSGDSRQEA